MTCRGRRGLACLTLAFALLAASGPLRALTPESGVSEPPAGLFEKSAEKTTRQLELEAVQRTLQMTGRQRAAREAELTALRADRAKLNEALIAAGQRLRDTESRVSAIEQRLATLAFSEAAIRRSLEGRRGVIVEVLAALQRMGRRPPPAILVRPEDMLQAVRASMLLGAVLPELRSETEALAGDLAELARLKNAAANESAALAGDVQSLVDDRASLAELVEARQAEIQAAERDAADQANQAGALASRAQTLKDLIGRLEAELETSARIARQAQEAADKAEAEARKAVESQVQQTRDKIAALAFRDPARLAPKVAFGEMKGLLPLPASGNLIKGFNAPDGLGGVHKGLAYATRPGALVTSPADGWVAYAGPFRTYGQLLIVNAGQGYYLLLAGMDRINVGLGQFVLAGEPVAVMGDSSKAIAAPAGSETSQPVLYIEFRKDGTSIDPSPWWATSTHEKVRG